MWEVKVALAIGIYSFKAVTDGYSFYINIMVMCDKTYKPIWMDLNQDKS